MDRRLTPFSGRVALRSLAGLVDAPLVDGTPAQVTAPLADLRKSPGGARVRQVLFGEGITVIDRDQGHAFVQAAKDGYCGWVYEGALGAPVPPTHWVCSPGTHLYAGPKVQMPEVMTLTHGARLQVLAVDGPWAQVPQGFVPACHLRALGDVCDDHAGIAETFLGTPYLWGGNSRAGMDCSGLAQAALLACGIPCPGDSDLQRSVGQPLPDDAMLQRGDLLFWNGHVAVVVDGARLIHANGHSMSVAHEATDPCIARILAQGGGPVIARRRP